MHGYTRLVMRARVSKIRYYQHLLVEKTALDEHSILEKLSPQLRQEVGHACSRGPLEPMAPRTDVLAGVLMSNPPDVPSLYTRAFGCTLTAVPAVPWMPALI